MTATSPIRVYCDFNAGGPPPREGYWLLFHNGRPLADQIDELSLTDGSEVVLYQDEDDFEVPAALRRGRTFWGEGEESWLAFPDWSRKVELP